MSGRSLQTVPSLFLTSLIYLVSASVWYNSNQDNAETAYAVSAAVISTFICLVLLVSQKQGSSAVTTYAEPIAGFLMLWWLFAACYGTFHGPFTGVGNGYFSAWASCYFAFRFAYESSDHIRHAMDAGIASVARKEGEEGNWNQSGAGAEAGGTTA